MTREDDNNHAIWVSALQKLEMQDGDGIIVRTKGRPNSERLADMHRVLRLIIDQTECVGVPILFVDEADAVIEIIRKADLEARVPTPAETSTN